jgi:hypothetical protein
VGHDVPRHDVVDRDPELLGHERGEAAIVDGAEPPHRHDVLLAVERDAPFVHLPIEVDRELGQPQDRAVDLDEAHLAGAQCHSSRKAEVAVEPRVDERPAVHVDGNLAVPDAARVGARLHPQIRAVRVGADDHEPGGRVGGDVPGDDRAAPHDERATAVSVDRGAGLHAAEAGFLEHGGDRLGRVVGRGRARQELEKVGRGLGHPYNPAVKPVPRRCALSLSVSTVRSPVRAPITR